MEIGLALRPQSLSQAPDQFRIFSADFWLDSDSMAWIEAAPVRCRPHSLCEKEKFQHWILKLHSKKCSKSAFSHRLAGRQRMHQATVQLSLKLDYKEIPVPPKIIIQLEPGEIRFFKRIKYMQHETDPVSATKLTMKYEGGNQLQIAMQLCGRLVLNPGGEFKFGGTKLIMVCTPVVVDNKLMLQQAKIKDVEFPIVPKFLERFLRNLMNKSFIPNLSQSLVFDLDYILQEIENKINVLPPIPLTIGKQNFLFNISPHLADGFHLLTLSRDAVHLNITLDFAPDLKLEEISVSENNNRLL
jgi:hypothetical protein